MTTLKFTGSGVSRVTLITDNENIELWYLDGVYIGHDDQVNARDIVTWLLGDIIVISDTVLCQVSAQDLLEDMRAELGL